MSQVKGNPLGTAREKERPSDRATERGSFLRSVDASRAITCPTCDRSQVVEVEKKHKKKKQQHKKNGQGDNAGAALLGQLEAGACILGLGAWSPANCVCAIQVKLKATPSSLECLTRF